MSVHIDWRMTDGVAGRGNFALVLAILVTFPLVLRWTGALSVAHIDPHSPQHTYAFIKFCSVLTAFLWVVFTITFLGIRRKGKISWKRLIGARWTNWRSIICDLGIAVAVLFTMAVIGNLFNALPPSLQGDSAAFHSMVAQNSCEALAFLVAALTAGFVEEFVFRGYIQRQCQALCGNTICASLLQVAAFTQGHFYQGWIRLIPVLLIGFLLTFVALRRKSLIPGMIAHGFGDGLVAFIFFVRHL